MKVLLLNTFDNLGGAGRAAYRLHQGLQQIGVDSQVLVNKQATNDPSVLPPSTPLAMAIAQARARIDQAALQFYPQRTDAYFSPQWLPDKLVNRVRQLQPDVVNVHWTQAGFMQIETLTKFECPVVLTLHDMWPMTGGCHYSLDCERYLERCGACPQLGSDKEQDLSRRVWERKYRAWQRAENLTLVTLCQWMGNCAAKSPILSSFPQRQIANGLDLDVYKPIETTTAKSILGIEPGKLTLLFVALRVNGDRRKGFTYLIQALQQLAEMPDLNDRLEVLVLGQQDDTNLPTGRIAIRSLGSHQDDLSLRMIYSAADVFVAPSIADNLPNTVVEAFACGTPAVAFNAGGLPDIIDHQQNGYLAEEGNVTDLTTGIHWALQHSKDLGVKARQKAEAHFEFKQQAECYRQLFERITEM